MKTPEELDAQVPDEQGSFWFQLFESLLHFGSGWFANHLLLSAILGSSVTFFSAAEHECTWRGAHAIYQSDEVAK